MMGILKIVLKFIFIYSFYQKSASSFGIPKDPKILWHDCPSKYTNTGSKEINFCIRLPYTEATYHDAKAICEASSGSLVRVEQLKLIDWKIIKDLVKYPIFRLDAIKGHDGQWLTSKSKPVDFSDFPNFDQNVGEPGTSILWVIKAFGSPVLFTIPSDISSTIKFMFYPICSAAAIVKEDSCITVDGPSSGLPCIFPFVYKGLLHKTCTYLDSDLTGGKPWCSTLVDITGHHVSGQGNWGICDSNCPMPKDNCFTIAGQDPLAECIFPFIYRGILHKTCSLIDSTPGVPWCATKVDDEGHAIIGKGKWGICNPKCPLPPGIKHHEGAVTVPHKCFTIAGHDPLAPCIFPFFYRGILHNTCSLIDSKPGVPWCPTKIDNQRHAVVGKGKWGICDPRCPMPSENKHEDNFYGGTVTDLDKCITIAGPDSYAPCISPFIYKGILHKTCSLIDAKPDAPWCPTKVDNKGHAILGKGKWGICGPECPIPPEDKCITVAGADPHVPCIFPFIYRGIVHRTCSLIGAEPGKAWCPTEVNEGHANLEDGKWGICGSQCP